MKQVQIAEIYKLIDSFANNESLTRNDQWALYLIRKDLRKYYDFYAEQMEKLRNKYMQYADSNGILKAEKAAEYRKELEEIENFDTEIEEKPKYKMNLPDKVTFKQIEMLEDFIEFIPPEN